MNDPAPLDDNALVYAALSLFGNKVSGTKPDWHEIEAWQQPHHQKGLTDERAAEVLSHIANDAECFQQWLDVCEASEWLAHENLPATSPAETGQSIEHTSTLATINNTLKNWFASLFGQPLPVYAAGFAALFLAVLVVPLLQDGGNLQQRLDDSYELYMAAPPAGEITAPLPRKTRTLGNLFDDVTAAKIEQYYFNQGLRQGFTRLQASPNASWTEWLEALPADKLDCAKATDPDACRDVAGDYTMIGKWAAMVYSACQADTQADITDNPESREFWQQQISLHSDLQQLPAMRDSLLLRPIMSTHTGDDKVSVCASVGQLLSTLQ